MNADEFKTKYPNVVFTVGDDIRHDATVTPPMLAHAKENICRMFDLLPEDQSTILNQLGLKFELAAANRFDSESEAANPFQARFFREKDDPLPQKISLSAPGFTSFSYKPGIPLDDLQRYHQMYLNEEATHAVCKRLIEHPKWQRAVYNDVTYATQDLIDLLHYSRVYYSHLIPEETEPQHKQPLQKYRGAKSEKERLVRFTEEIPAEIMHFRNFLKVAKSYGDHPPFARAEVNDALRLYHRKLANVPSVETDKAIDAMLGQALPHSYPLFQDYRERLVRQAEDVKASIRDGHPERFPVMSKMTEREHLREQFRIRKTNHWNNAFKGFGKGAHRG